jgi:hypothetical protein
MRREDKRYGPSNSKHSLNLIYSWFHHECHSDLLVSSPSIWILPTFRSPCCLHLRGEEMLVSYHITPWRHNPEDLDVNCQHWWFPFGILVTLQEPAAVVKVQLSLCLTKHHAMKTYWGSGGIAPRVLGYEAGWALPKTWSRLRTILKVHEFHQSIRKCA